MKNIKFRAYITYGYTSQELNDPVYLKKYKKQD